MSRPATTDREGMQRIREALARVEQQLAYISRERAPGPATQVPGLDIAIVKADEDIAGIEEPEGESDNDFEVHTGECTVYRLLSDGGKVLREKSWKLEGRQVLHNVGKTAIGEGDVLIALGDADTGWWIGAAVGGGGAGYYEVTTAITARDVNTLGQGEARKIQRDGETANLDLPGTTDPVVIYNITSFTAAVGVVIWADEDGASGDLVMLAANCADLGST